MSESMIEDVVQKNDFLMGILLGYGRQNSLLFHQGKRLVSFVEPEEIERFSRYIASQGFWGFATGALFQDLSMWPLPGFAVDETLPETSQLRTKYRASRQKLIAYFDRRNFLDAALEGLCVTF
jgi:hypothetical protein